MLIELGANDGLRGLPLKTLRANLTRMAQLARASGAQPVLLEMLLPPNYGLDYAGEFWRSYAQVAREQKAVLVPFFLADIALNWDYFQDDLLHPNADAQPLMLDAVWKVLKPHLKQDLVRK